MVCRHIVLRWDGPSCPAEAGQNSGWLRSQADGAWQRARDRVVAGGAFAFGLAVMKAGFILVSRRRSRRGEKSDDQTRRYKTEHH